MLRQYAILAKRIRSTSNVAGMSDKVAETKPKNGLEHLSLKSAAAVVGIERKFDVALSAR